MLKIAILGLGDRGMNYGNLVQTATDSKITAICEKDTERLKLGQERFHLPDTACFTDSSEFLAQERLADVMFVCTQDRDHYSNTMDALEKGYHVLVEKPVSPNPEHLKAIIKKAEEKDRKVLVCHVLRYSLFYRKIKELLDSGSIGRTILIRHAENIGFWHFSHSFVRGHWHKEAETSPMILAKCCHDMDLLYWWTGSKFRSVSSNGQLTFYTPENRPDGAADRCCICPLNKTCLYDAKLQYIGREDHPEPFFPWGTYAVTNTPGNENILKALETNNYGKCVFSGENDVMDCQTAQFVFENGVTAQFSVNGFSNENYRSTHIFGTKGEIWCNDLDETITLREFGKEKTIFNMSLANQGYGGGHVGGDIGLVRDSIRYFSGEQMEMGNLTSIKETLESHLMADACEKSRKLEGKLIFHE